jgi:hypothetical protein
MWRNELYAIPTEYRVEFVGVIGIVADEILRSFGIHHFEQGRNSQLHFVWGGALDMHGAGYGGLQRP